MARHFSLNGTTFSNIWGMVAGEREVAPTKIREVLCNL